MKQEPQSLQEARHGGRGEECREGVMRGEGEPSGCQAFPPQHINETHPRLGRSGVQHTPSRSNETVYSALEFPPSLEVYVSFQ